jgi:BirA family biotin operon repressor/biotin-[acetyl-CoA-carboxylase] ligase
MTGREPPIVRMGVVSSTQALAFELAAGGADDGTVVVAASQTAGRGRRGRRWEDEPGASLLVSIVVRPSRPPREWPRLSFAAALAVADMLAEVAALPARLKWPNDVLVAGRKIAGILLESRSGLAVVVVGIGVNLAQRQFPAELAGRATSVALETSRTVDREIALSALLHAFRMWRGRLEGEGFGTLRQRWLALSDTIGRAVAGDGWRGEAVDLDEDGALLLRSGGELHRVVAGEIEA